MVESKPEEDKDNKEKEDGGPENVDAPAYGQVLEVDVGITEYISTHKGVSAIIKQRYSDFIVNEISLAGEEIHLTSTDMPTEPGPPEPPPPQPAAPVDPVLNGLMLIQLRELANSPDSKLTVSIRVGDDKEKRQKIHCAIKDSFPTLETMTEEREGGKFITVMQKKSAVVAQRAHNKPGPFGWPANQKTNPYCRFVLYKENKDTMDCISLIAKFLRLKPQLFQYAGTKDRRAKTTQAVTAHRVHPKKLRHLNNSLRNIMLGNFAYVDKPFKLGQLQGNRFTIVLRNVQGEDDDVDKGLETLKETGFINYYGLQRFGTTSVPTHRIGKAILAEKWEEAVDLILRPRPCTAALSEKFREVWAQTKDPRQTLAALGFRRHIERTVLKALCKDPTNYLGAIAMLPRNTRIMYVHAYQSYVWNTVVSLRIRTYGLKPVVGDLVMPAGTEEHTETDAAMETATDSAMDTSAASGMDDGEAGTGDGDDAAAGDGEKTESGNGANVETGDGENAGTGDGTDNNEAAPVEKRRPKVRPIMLDETTVSQYTVYDVMMPLPGFDVIYPSNDCHEWYKTMLHEDGFDINQMERKQKDFSMPGTYRLMVVKPKGVEWNKFQYDDYTIPLTLSDKDRLNDTPEPQSVPDGKMRAVSVSFVLPCSCYATMALREVLKSDTSASHQTTLNVT